MIDVEVPVINALENDPSTLSIVEDKIHRWVVPKESAGDYPYIRVVELNNTDNDYADNKARASDIDLQIDLWTKGDPSTLQNSIDKVMKSLSFKRTSVTSFYEESTGAIRKALRYTTKIRIFEEE